ncbi:MAG TPA: FtsQ-type POTRA domain-containing protein [Terriglobales bacterium]|nr:FtsQ-type POTRA domain-containing protein [Terriglobales bacterium]
MARRLNQGREAPPRTQRQAVLAVLAPLRRACGAAVLPALVVAVVAIVAPTLWLWTKQHRYFALSAVVVRGNARIPRDQVAEWSGARLGASTWDVDTAAVAARLEQQTWIQRAEASIELPNRLRITIRERKPMALARLDALYYVDRRGHLLGPLGEEDSRDFPIITGLDDKRHWDRAHIILPRAAQLIRWCERHKCFDMISEVRVERDRSMTVFPMRPQVAVVFGWGSWNEKMERLNRVWATYRGHESKLATVDLSFPGAVVVKLKEMPEPPAAATARKTKV